MRHFVVLAIALSATACVTEKSFPKQMAAAQCKSLESCSKAQFSAAFDDVKDCVEDTTDALEATFDALDRACDFEAKYAKRCIASMNAYTKSCDQNDGVDANADCARAYDCGGGGGGDTAF